LEEILKSWTLVVQYFDEIIVEKDAFLDSRLHDTLLTDDESFSRSKRYFWAITTLREMHDSISNNLLETRRLMTLGFPEKKLAEELSKIKHPREWLPLATRKRPFEDICSRLEELSKKLDKRLGEVTELRNGVSRVLVSCSLF
jgi:hypothetical protein